MQRVLVRLTTLLLLLGAAGCGDTPDVLCHDLLVFYNEVCDNQVLIYDEQSATEFMTGGKYKVLKDRWEAIKNRVKDRLPANDLQKDKELRDNLIDAELDYYDEAVATHKRMHSCYKRLDGICESISQENQKKNLIKARDLVASEFLLVGGGGGGGGGNNVKVSDSLITTGDASKGGKWGYGLLPLVPKPKGSK